MTPAEARAAVRNHAADKTDTDERPSVAEETDIRSEGIATARAREVDALAKEDVTVLDGNPNPVGVNERDVGGRGFETTVDNFAAEVLLVPPVHDSTGELLAIRTEQELGDAGLDVTADRVDDEVGVGADPELGKRHGLVYQL
ncbi:MAG: hypothetical protein UX09_C0018G0001 [Candidatus Uhrbacteria bacterium GW2011_GWE2_45_35]|uniref:Uncharacterized protein n=2 Tax=Candidatus Uhriibacteriota TaxID=1752732 RepID=A0A0G1M950_9BACT|nr:MAG: hypothetical protein UW63_C0077G0005 [Candidatus Uhrbacteria bacterium GW2011_GWF2_44_350]KKU08374.1 MAG: hypothetical protein UX09_C0018G0001 [Candidatus Uhrbacteria bacterium GW2011_GWE2_45_35]